MADLLADLVEFARIEVESRDVEPWADLLAVLDVDDASVLWLVYLYNAYDSMESAWRVAERWPSPRAWERAPDRPDAAAYPIMQERRNLHGGRMNRRHDSFCGHLAGQPQGAWLRQGCVGASPPARFDNLQAHLRSVWGVGRQAAFEWAEFVVKVGAVTGTEAGHGMLWESSGPRQSLEAIYGPARDHIELDNWAADVRNLIHDATGHRLAWVDFETVVCDFKVMTRGRYYPGRHLAALREEIAAVGDPPALVEAWRQVVPEPWRSIAPGIDKAKLSVYRDTGTMVTEP